jgi:four helix bundle protein
MGDFRKLRVWRHAHALMLNVHRVAAGIRGAQYLSLRSQMIRAAMSIPTNIVEGRAQKSERDFVRFLGYAIASTRELEYHLLAARDLGVISQDECETLMNQTVEVRKMLTGLIARLEARTVTRTMKGPVVVKLHAVSAVAVSAWRMPLLPELTPLLPAYLGNLDASMPGITRIAFL